MAGEIHCCRFFAATHNVLASDRGQPWAPAAGIRLPCRRTENAAPESTRNRRPVMLSVIWRSSPGTTAFNCPWPQHFPAMHMAFRTRLRVLHSASASGRGQRPTWCLWRSHSQTSPCCRPCREPLLLCICSHLASPPLPRPRLAAPPPTPLLLLWRGNHAGPNSGPPFQPAPLGPCGLHSPVGL
jgi:hypothetical protein